MSRFFKTQAYVHDFLNTTMVVVLLGYIFCSPDFYNLDFWSMIMSFLTFCLSSQLFSKGRFIGLSSLWCPLTCNSYGVGVLQFSGIRA